MGVVDPAPTGHPATDIQFVKVEVPKGYEIAHAMVLLLDRSGNAHLVLPDRPDIALELVAVAVQHVNVLTARTMRQAASRIHGNGGAGLVTPAPGLIP